MPCRNIKLILFNLREISVRTTAYDVVAHFPDKHQELPGAWLTPDIKNQQPQTTTTGETLKRDSQVIKLSHRSDSVRNEERVLMSYSTQTRQKICSKTTTTVRNEL